MAMKALWQQRKCRHSFDSSACCVPRLDHRGSAFGHAVEPAEAATFHYPRQGSAQMTMLAIFPDQAAFAFRAALTLDRSIVGALGFLAFAALLRGARWHESGGAALGALLVAWGHAETSVPARRETDSRSSTAPGTSGKSPRESRRFSPREQIMRAPPSVKRRHLGPVQFTRR